MNFRRYLLILSVLLLAVLMVHPALAENVTGPSINDVPGVITNHSADNVKTIVTNYTADLESDNATRNFNYGQQSVSLGDLPSALVFYNLALSENQTMLKKTDALQYLYQGKTYALIQLKRYNEAVAAADEGLTVYPRDAMLWNNKGYALYLQGKQQDALLAYTTAVSYDGNYTNAYINQGDVLSEMGRYTEAVKAYTRANETDPFNIAASDGLAVAKKGEAQSAGNMTILFVIVLIIAAGVLVWYIKFRKPAEPAPEEKKRSKKK